MSMDRYPLIGLMIASNCWVQGMMSVWSFDLSSTARAIFTSNRAPATDCRRFATLESHDHNHDFLVWKFIFSVDCFQQHWLFGILPGPYCIFFLILAPYSFYSSTLRHVVFWKLPQYSLHINVYESEFSAERRDECRFHGKWLNSSETQLVGRRWHGFRR